MKPELDHSHVGRLLSSAVADGAWPGGVLTVGVDGERVVEKPFGTHTRRGQRQTRVDDVFDLASLTKVVATTAAAMQLWAEGLLNLDTPVSAGLTAFACPGTEQAALKGRVTVEHLLTHTSGLPAYRPFHRTPGDAAVRLQQVLATPLEHDPGTCCVYSDIGFIILGLLLEAIAHERLDVCVQQRVWQPLAMHSTCFNPSNALLRTVVPTEYSEEEQGFIHGHVHDENAYALGGVAGHAGAVSTAGDLANYAQMLLDGGSFRAVELLSSDAVRRFTCRTGPVPDSCRCLGWAAPSEASSGGVYLSDASFGHTGFTGTSMWVDPANRIYVVLLTNAVHPDRSQKTPTYFDWRQRIHSGVYEALGFDRPNPRLKWRPRWQQTM